MCRLLIDVWARRSTFERTAGCVDYSSGSSGDIFAPNRPRKNQHRSSRHIASAARCAKKQNKKKKGGKRNRVQEFLRDIERHVSSVSFLNPTQDITTRLCRCEVCSLCRSVEKRRRCSSNISKQPGKNNSCAVRKVL